jgi:preprotein translocase subunit YajC
MFFLSQAFAQTAATSPASQPTMALQLFPLILIIGVFYFIVARPQQKKLKEQQNFLQNLKKGDSVVTSGGILGEVHGITDLIVTLQVSENTKIKILKSQIAKLVKEEKKS